MKRRSHFPHQPSSRRFPAAACALLILACVERSSRGADLPQIPFVDVTQEAGIVFTHDNGARGEKLLPEAYGAGAAFFDANQDDAPDILLVNGAPLDGAPTDGIGPTLWLNDGRGRFTDASAAAGLSQPLRGMGVAAADFDADGWCDVYITCVGHNRLYRNVAGRFEDWTDRAGVAGGEQEWSTAACWFDLERDGDLDLFVANYVAWSADIDLRLDTRLLGDERAYGHPDSFGGTPARLFRHDPGGQFTNISEQAGVRILNPDTQLPGGKALAATPVDVDDDGWTDIVVANDGTRNLLFLNQRNGTFAEAGEAWGLAYANTGLSRRATGLDAEHFRADGTLAICMGGVAHQPARCYCRHAGLPLFTEDASSTGIGPQTHTPFNFAMLFCDADLDGRPDLLSVNGHVEPQFAALQPAQTYAQSPLLLWNAGSDAPREFVRLPVEHCGPDFSQPLVGRGAATADVDGDGDLDLLITANGGAPRLLRNDQQLGNHWLRVKLQDQGANRDSLGARLTLTAGNQTLIRDVRPARGYLSQSETVVTFGLGVSDGIDALRIRWPDGSVSDHTGLAVDQLHHITHGQ